MKNYSFITKYKVIIDETRKKQFIALAFSSLVLPVFTFLTVLLLTRSMTSNDYGEYVYVIGFYNFILQLCGLGFFPTIRLLAGQCNTSNEKNKIFSASLLLAVLGGIGLSLVVILSVSVFYHYDNSIPYWLIVLMLPLGIVYVLTSVYDNLLQGLSYLTELSASRVYPKLLFLLFVVVLAYFELEMPWYLLSWHLSFLLVYGFMFFSLKITFSYREGMLGLKEICRTNRKFGIHVYLGNVLLLAGMQLAPISIGFFTEDKSQIAYYALGLTLTAPLAMLPQLFSTLFFKDFVKNKTIPNKLFLFVNLISISIGAVLFLMSDFIINLAYGEEFIGALAPFKILIIFSLLNGVNLFIDRFFHAKGAGKTIRNGALISGTALIISYFFLVPEYLSEGVSIALLISATINLIYKLCQYVSYVSCEAQCE